MWTVVLHHLLGTPGFGWVSMQTFFVLSGFLITRMLLVEQHLPLREGLKLFYWRRALRIFPALYAYLLIMLVVSYVSADFASARPMIGWSAIFLQNIAWMNSVDAGITKAGIMATQHLWSLCVEEHFYVVWPLVFLMAGPRLRMPLVVVLIVAGPCLRWLIQENWTGTRHYAEVIYVFSGSHIDAFAIGALVTLLWNRRSIRHPSLKRFLALCAAVVTVGMLVAQHPLVPRDFTDIRTYAFGYPLYMHESGQGVWGYTLVNLLAAQLMILAVDHPGLARFLNHRFLVWSGKISFGMYLLHQPVLYLFLHLQLWMQPYLGSRPSIALVSIAYLVVIFIIGSFCFRYFESYFFRFRPRPRTRVEPVGPTPLAHDPAPARTQ